MDVDMSPQGVFSPSFLQKVHFWHGSHSYTHTKIIAQLDCYNVDEAMAAMWIYSLYLIRFELFSGLLIRFQPSICLGLQICQVDTTDDRLASNSDAKRPSSVAGTRLLGWILGLLLDFCANYLTSRNMLISSLKNRQRVVSPHRL
jgi:hypothetical protein